MTALSIGIGYPAAKLLLEHCEDKEGLAFHIMIASNPELDDKITSEPGGRPMAVQGFTGADTSASSLDVARVWTHYLPNGTPAALHEICTSVAACSTLQPVPPTP